VPATIPIKNIYYLLSYAWDQLEQGELVDVSSQDSTELLDLFADVLSKGTEHLIRRGLEQSYVEITEATTAIRGKIQIFPSARRMLFEHGKALCTYDEMTVDTKANQVIKAALKYLSSHKDVDSGLRKKMLGLVRVLPDVSDKRFDRFALRGIQLHRNNRFYKFLLNVCGLVLEQALVTEKEGANRFRDFVRDEHRMRRLFEKFLKNFYKHHLLNCEVKSEKINWWVDSDIEQNVSLLPSMTTDISIRDGEKTLVIDAKFKQSVFQKNFNKSSFHSDNLYQLFSYLKNMEGRDGADATASGMLIYPLVNEAVHEDYSIHGHNISIRTIDLTLEWKEIEASLLGFVEIYNPGRLKTA